MKLPVIQGIIDRRILVNFRLDAATIGSYLPAPFRPKLVEGKGMGGICLIRLKDLRPGFVPGFLGMGSENAAHRIAVEWDENGETKEGVYIPRRDTSSKLSTLLGGRIFPGVHNPAIFKIKEEENFFSVNMTSKDEKTYVKVTGEVSDEFPRSSVFNNVEDASSFFEKGSLGYSDTRVPGRFDGLELSCINWKVKSLDVKEVGSSFFDDVSIFPRGSAEFDCALLMQNIDHRWYSRDDLKVPVAEQVAG